MKNAVLALPLLLVSSLALAGAAAKPHPQPGSYPEKADDWKKFAVLDTQLGTPLFKAPGFTCGPDPAEQGYSTYRRTCVKFLDSRCKGRPTKIHHIRSSADVPAGQGCFMDEGSGQTYLDRKAMPAPLSATWIVGTDTSSALIYEINYTFAKDVLTRESNIGKALIAKYGQPSSTNEPISMEWSTSNGVHLRAACGSTVGPTGDFCSTQASDDTILDLERSIQQAFDAEQTTKNGPVAPRL